jgi:ABC-type uncharacterized transport system involved in gliding motility auxiliary subunit
MSNDKNLLQQMSGALTSRGTRLGTNATIMTIAFLGILVLINIILMRNHQRWDLTQTGEFSLSQKTEQIIENLDQEVRVIGFFAPNDPTRGKDATSKMKEYTSRSDMISYEVVDPDANPMIARQYGITSYGMMVIESGDRQQRIINSDEQSITGAILKVTQEHPTTVYFLTGHEERSIEDTQVSGYARVRNALVEDNYEVEPINLVISETIPLERSVLVVADPLERLQKRERRAIGSYVAGGGRLLLMSNPVSPEPLEEIMEAVGLEWNDDVIVDRGSSELGNPVAPAITEYPPSAITNDMSGMATIFPDVRTITEVDTPPDGVSITPFLSSSEESQAVTDITEDGRIEPSDDDRQGPLTFGYTIEGVVTPTLRLSGEPTGESSRIVVIGDVDFASNRYVGTPPLANGALFMNAISWLGEQEELISLPEKEQIDRTIFLSGGQSNFVFFSSVFGVPLVVIVIGLVVWWRRR